MTIIVLDGQGGGIGRAIISALLPLLPQGAQLLCVGTNAMATAAMLKAGAQRGATGVEVTVHDTQYQLTHLLENDHAIKNQTGRTFGTAKGDKVISRIADRIGRQFSGGDAK